MEFKDEFTRKQLLDALNFNADGLICAIAQDHSTKNILMVAWMNREALDETLKSGQVVYTQGRDRRCGAKVNHLVKHNN